MVFAATPSWVFLALLLAVPTIAVIATVVSVLVSLHSRWAGNGKWWPAPMSRRWYAGVALLALCDAWALLMAWETRSLEARMASEGANKAARAAFMLPHDSQHGELLFPAGTRVVRYDPFDSGEPGRPLKLTGLKQAHFARPVNIAGVDAISLDLEVSPLGAAVTLAHDENVHGVECKKGQTAMFSVPPIEYDVVAEFGKEQPDGSDARFKPSQWRFERCTEGIPVLHTAAENADPLARRSVSR